MWEEIVGHRDIIISLQNLLQRSQCPHAFLFLGPQGVGKFKVAETFAAGILCHEHEAPCGKCACCQAVRQGKNLDLMVIEPDGANIKIEQIRALKHQAAMTSYSGYCRVCIIDGADRMTQEAANSLLKLLEEPPSNFIMILTAVSQNKILPTLQSRTIIYKFQPLVYDQLLTILTARGFDKQQAAANARISGGSVGEAIELFDPEIASLRRTALAMLTTVPQGLDSIWEQAQLIDKLDNRHAAFILKFLVCFVRDCVMLNLGSAYQEFIINQDVKNEMQDICTAWTKEQCVCAYDIIKEAHKALQGNANTRLVFESLLIQLHDILQGGNIVCQL